MGSIAIAGGAGSNLPGLPTTTPTVKDTVIGIDNGIAYQFPITDVGFIPAQANVDLYVATTGSDSNPGTLAQPFLTIQHAVTVAAFYDYQGLYSVTIHLATGTFNITSPVTLAELKNISGAFITGAGVGLTTINDVPANGCIYNPTDTSWDVRELTLDTDGWGVWADGGSLFIGFGKSIAFANTSGFADAPSCFAVSNGGRVECDACTITLDDTACGPLFRATAVLFTGEPGGNMLFTFSTLNLPASPLGVGAFIDIFSIPNMDVQFYFMTVANAASWQGLRVSAGGGGLQTFLTDDGTFSTIPGTSFAVDESVLIQKLTGLFGGRGGRFFSNQLSVAPSTNNIGDQQWAVFKDSDGVQPTVSISYNDGGIIKQSDLNERPIRLAESDLNFYVALSGSDSNPGTISQPFLTPQRAAFVAASYDYQFLYFPTINIGTGKFSMTTQFNLPPLLNCSFGVITGNGSALTTLYDQNQLGCVGCHRAPWKIRAITFDSDVACLQLGSDPTLFVDFGDEIGFANTSGFTDNPACVTMNALGQAEFVVCTLNVYDTAVAGLYKQGTAFFTGEQGGSPLFLSTTLNLPASPYGGGQTFIDCATTAGWPGFANMTINNAASWTGQKFNGGGSNYPTGLLTDDGTPAPIPGTGFHDDMSCMYIDLFNGGHVRYGSNQFAGIPTATQLGPQQWGVFKDTSGGGVYVAYNDAGTIKKVALV